MIKRSLLLSLLSLLLVAGFIWSGTIALFTDSESSTGNTFTAGNINLQLKDNDEVWGDGVTATWHATNMSPGDELNFDIEQIELRNMGSIPGTTVDITVQNSVIDPPGPNSDTEEGTTDMDKVMEITWMEYEDGSVHNVLSHISDVNGNGYKDLDDLEAAGVSGLGAMTGTGRFQMHLRFHPDADNDYQGDTLVCDVIFTINQ